VKVFTKAGDAGETGLSGGERIAKDNGRVEAYGAVDELNRALSVARAALARRNAARPGEQPLLAVPGGHGRRAARVGMGLTGLMTPGRIDYCPWPREKPGSPSKV